MGKSAKFYKRPSKKEKEGIAVKKLVEPSAITKNKRVGNPINIPTSILKQQQAESTNSDNKRRVGNPITVPASVFGEKNKKKAGNTKTEEDIDMMEEDKPVTETKKEKLPESELPDYVDLFSGKKTYKKIPKKRK